MDLERDDPRGQAAAAPRERGDRRAALRRVQQQAGVATARVGVGREQRSHAAAEIGHRRVRVAHRAGRTHGRAGAAAHAQMRLDRHVIAVGADRLRRADVDALRAADLLRPGVRADRRLVSEVLRLLELADHRRELGHRQRLRDRIGARREISLRRLVHRQLRRPLQIEHEVEPLRARPVLPVEVDRGGRAAGGNALAVRLAALDVHLIAPVDRLLRTGLDARIAARAEIEVDRVVLGPADVERAEPAGEFRDACPSRPDTCARPASPHPPRGPSRGR